MNPSVDSNTSNVETTTQHTLPTLASAETVIEARRYDPFAIEVFTRTDGMGQSVRTLRPFKRGEVVCSYGGKVLPLSERPQSEYLLQLTTKLIVDGDPKLPEAQGHVGNLINDAMGPIREAGKTNNVYFSLGSVKTASGKKERTVLLKTKRNLPQECTELFVSYGPSYWPRSKRAKSVAASEE